MTTTHQTPSAHRWNGPASLLGAVCVAAAVTWAAFAFTHTDTRTGDDGVSDNSAAVANESGLDDATLEEDAAAWREHAAGEFAAVWQRYAAGLSRLTPRSSAPPTAPGAAGSSTPASSAGGSTAPSRDAPA